MLERGITVRQGLRFLRAELPGILATRTDALSPRMLRILEDLMADWRRLDTRVEELSSEIEALARQDKGCERLMSIPGIGPIISSAVVAAIGTGDAFSKGRDFGAWLGLVPKQLSTGYRTILGSISKRGYRYLRSLFVQAAWVVLVKIGPKHWDRYGLKSWIEAAKKRLHHNVLAIALANKLARIAWAVLHKGRAFECVKTNEAATPTLARFCRWLSAAGLQVYAPILFGRADATNQEKQRLARLIGLCVSREISLFARGRSSPIVDWLKPLCRKAHQEWGGRGVGVIGMCLTGGFALSMAVDPAEVKLSSRSNSLF